MSRCVSIIMYHYVRDLERSRYPNIKGLTVAAFREQVRFFRKHYNLIGAWDLMDALNERAPLPPKAMLLTFDDGFVDHFTNVFPILDEYGIPGAFFPPVACITESRILDVNKIHFVLASVSDKQRLIDLMFDCIREAEPGLGLKTPEEYRTSVDTSGRWDTPDVSFLKRMLQRELPEAFRGTVINKLFHTYVTNDEAAFSRELYMTPDQVRCMARHSMYFGNHGYGHYWLNRLDADGQRKEVDRGLAFMRDVGIPTDRWIMNYPHGGHDEGLLAYLRETNCSAALCTAVDVANLDRDAPLLLPRLNTNDFPVDASAPVNAWYSAG